MDARPVTVLAGGVGAARFLQGVVDVVAPERVVAIGNVGDDVERHGLHVSPDLDTVLYTLTGWIDEIAGAEAILIAPSNPLISIEPILAVPGVREAVAARSAPGVAVSPIVAGRAIRGPAAAMLESLGHGASPVAVARIYDGLIDALVLDRADAGLAREVEGLGLRAVVTDTIMRDQAARAALARTALEAAGVRG